MFVSTVREQVAEGDVRQAHLGFGGAGGEDAPAAFDRSLTGLLEQRRLADADVPHDDGRPETVGGRLE